MTTYPAPFAAILAAVFVLTLWGAALSPVALADTARPASAAPRAAA